MSYIPKDAVTQSFRSNKGVLTPNQIIELDNENKFTKYGQLELIQTQSASDVNSIEFSSIQENVYDVHFLTVTNFSAVSSSCGGQLQLLESGVAKTSGYEFAYQQADLSSGSPFTEQKTTSGTSMVSFDFDPVTPRNTYAYIYNAGDNTKYTYITAHYVGINNSNLVFRFGRAVCDVASNVDGIKIVSSNSNNFNIDNVSLYGIRFA